MTWKDIIIFSSLVLGFIIIHIIEHYSGTTSVSLDKESIKQEKSVYLVTRLMKPFLERTVRRAATKKVVEETVSASLSKALKDYDRHFEKD